MSYDPNQQQPDSGYGTPPYGTPPSGPYSQPQGPYGVPPQGPYSTPQGPYGAPPQSPYGAPPYQQAGGYGYAPPTATPLPLGEAIQQLPNQYIKVLTKPSAATFAEEMGKASWDIVWIQLITYAIAVAVLGFLRNLISNPFATLQTTSSSSSISPATIQLLTAFTSFGLIVLLPIGFFIGVGIYYLIARAFGGQGTFLAQGYTSLLFNVPIGIISSLLSLIPILGGLAASALGIYAIVLNVLSIMAVHRLSGGKATAVVLIPVAVVLVLACVLAIVFIAIIAAAVRQSQP